MRPLLSMRLKEAAQIEHALLAQYLYAMFSLKDEFSRLRGQGTVSAHFDLLGVAIEEMRHLHTVSSLMAWLKEPPRLAPLPFPFSFPRYRFFQMELRPLDGVALARYVFLEAPEDQLKFNTADLKLLARLKQMLGSDISAPDHVYPPIIDALKKMSEEPPDDLRVRVEEFPLWIRRLERLRDNGLRDHFIFFRDLFLGDSSLLKFVDETGEEKIATHSQLARPLHSPAADQKELAHLADLHYWIILGLLNLTYRFEDWRSLDDDHSRPLMESSQRHMRWPLMELGTHLAAKNVGLPFSPFPEKEDSYDWDDELRGRKIIRLWVEEAEAIATRLKNMKDHPDALPDGFKFNIYSNTLSVLATVDHSHTGQPV